MEVTLSTRFHWRDNAERRGGGDAALPFRQRDVTWDPPVPGPSPGRERQCVVCSIVLLMIANIHAPVTIGAREKDTSSGEKRGISLWRGGSLFLRALACAFNKEPRKMPTTGCL